MVGYQGIYIADCYFSIGIRVVTFFLLVAAMFYYDRSRRHTESYGLEHKHKPPTFCSHIPALIAFVLLLVGTLMITIGWMGTWQEGQGLWQYCVD